jgi:Zn-dependent peptidase ImmA (M78 family)
VDLIAAQPSPDVEAQTVTLLRDAHLYRVPVDVAALARHHGITVYAAQFADAEVSGAIEQLGPRRGRLWVNQLDPPVRQRFTIAHELGHWFLGHLETSRAVTDLSPAFGPAWAFRAAPVHTPLPPRERAANRFAAALLMPRPLLLDWVERDPRTLTHPDALARVFDVSVQALRIRLDELR